MEHSREMYVLDYKEEIRYDWEERRETYSNEDDCLLMLSSLTGRNNTKIVNIVKIDFITNTMTKLALKLDNHFKLKLEKKESTTQWDG